MEDNEKNEKESIKRKKPKYEPPQVRTYTGDDLLKELGPAQALYGPSVPLP
ncbi:MAG TPA: hypothetical protein VGB26_00210 [Nitrospiria bacterium]|jgi:hypothetical protein